MITINGHDYARSAKTAFLQLDTVDYLARELADTRQPLEQRANHIACMQSPQAVAAVIAKVRASYPLAHCFLPALHSHQLALWSNSNDQPL